ncbi:MAG: hypothetical protein WC010_02320 [Candidatus Absconditabacterales bacterium]
MKQYSLIILSIVFLLTGCGSKSSFSTIFDEFTIKLYDNKKQYIVTPVDTSIAGINILSQMKEEITGEDTGFINSFIIIKTSIQSGIDIKELVDSNTKQLQLKLLKYTSIEDTAKKIKCKKLQYSGYITVFSYQLDNETLYEGQYFFTDDQSLYIISLSSDDKKDITSFIKSIGTVKCTN